MGLSENIGGSGISLITLQGGGCQRRDRKVYDRAPQLSYARKRGASGGKGGVHPPFSEKSAGPTLVRLNGLRQGWERRARI